MVLYYNNKTPDKVRKCIKDLVKSFYFFSLQVEHISNEIEKSVFDWPQPPKHSVLIWSLGFGFVSTQVRALESTNNQSFE